MKQVKVKEREGNDNCNNRTKVITNGTSTGYASYSLPREMVPELMLEPGILTGYRPANMPWSFYFRSLFWIHNETGNIWTHLLSALFMVAMILSFIGNIDSEKSSSAHGLVINAVASSSGFLLSSTAHLLHSKSYEVHYVVFCFDYLGIVLYGYSLGVVGFYCSGSVLFFEKFASVIKWLAVLPPCSLIGLALGKTIYVKPCFKKKLLQIGPSCMSVICTQLPVVCRMYECLNQDLCQNSSDVYHAVSWFFFILSGILFSFHQPERIFPGKFDIWGHGHQLFHISLLVSTGTTLYASYIDLLETKIEILLLAKPDVKEINWNFGCSIFVNLGIIIIFYFIYKVKYKSTKQD